jgi:hypothetical protein
MSENLFCDGQKYITEDYKDGWYRVFKGYPSMNNDVIKMLKDYKEEGKFASILLFFADVCGYENEYAAFLMREVIRGYI